MGEKIARQVIRILVTNDEPISLDAIFLELRSSRITCGSKHLLRILKQYPSNFQTMENKGKTFVKLLLPLDICSKHCSKKERCQGPPSCSGLHVCKFFLLSGACGYSRFCSYGHDLTTPHNMHLLREYLLDSLSVQDIEKLFRNSLNRTTNTLPRICSYYNIQDGCRYSDHLYICPNLHICRYYVLGQCKFNERCIRNHDIFEPSVRGLLQKYHIDIQRRPRDIIADIRKTLDDEDGAIADQDDDVLDEMEREARPPTRTQTSKSAPTLRQTPARRMPVAKYGRTSGVWPAKSGSICTFYMQGRCRYVSDCWNIHRDTPYQWQWRHHNDQVWQDFDTAANVQMERVYCDPKIITVNVKIGTEETLQINLQTGTTADRKFEVRRISTISAVRAPTFPQATNWVWYWYNDHKDGDWVEYGDTDPGTEDHSSKASVEIEKKYLVNPVDSISIDKEYIIDFERMVERNHKQRTERAVRRRPVFVSLEDVLEREKSCGLLPKDASAVSGLLPKDASAVSGLLPKDASAVRANVDGSNQAEMQECEKKSCTAGKSKSKLTNKPGDNSRAVASDFRSSVSSQDDLDLDSSSSEDEDGFKSSHIIPSTQTSKEADFMEKVEAAVKGLSKYKDAECPAHNQRVYQTKTITRQTEAKRDGQSEIIADKDVIPSCMLTTKVDSCTRGADYNIVANEDTCVSRSKRPLNLLPSAKNPNSTICKTKISVAKKLFTGLQQTSTLDKPSAGNQESTMSTKKQSVPSKEAYVVDSLFEMKVPGVLEPRKGHDIAQKPLAGPAAVGAGLPSSTTGNAELYEHTSIADRRGSPGNQDGCNTVGERTALTSVDRSIDPAKMNSYELNQAVTKGGDSAPSTPTTGLPMKDVRDNLHKLIVVRKVDNETVFDWIESNVDIPTTKQAQFIRELMTEVFLSAITKVGTRTVLDRAQIKLRNYVLQKYLDHQAESELQALYALQALITRMNHPAGVLRQMFDILYDEDIISEDTFLQWEKSEEEPDGKGVAMKQVLLFFTWLKEADEES